MRSSQRFRGLKNWATKELCSGRMLKAPGPDGDITQIIRQEPRCYIGWTPTRPDLTGLVEPDPFNVCPGILIMPNQSWVKRMEEKRFDRYNNVHRPKELGQTVSVTMMFMIYEPGVRLPGFVDSADSEKGLDMSKIMEGTEEGFFTLMDWMDDCKEKLLETQFIPGTDLFLLEEGATYTMYNDQSFIVDKRPIFYGFVNAEFGCYAEDGRNPSIDEYLK